MYRLNQSSEDWYSVLRHRLTRLRFLQFDCANVVWFDLDVTLTCELSGHQVFPWVRYHVRCGKAGQ
jgi:hypothetical protein